MSTPANVVFFSVNPWGAGTSYDAKSGSPTITISGGVATLSVAQNGSGNNNIGVGCHIVFDDPDVDVFIAPNRIGYDSGSDEPSIGCRIKGQDSGAVGVVRAIELSSGAWGTNSAAGFIYFESTSGTWQNNEKIDIIDPTGEASTNIANIDGTLQGNIGNGNTQFVVKNPDGTDASDVASPISVDYIYHEWSSLVTAESQFTDSDHINNADFTGTGADIMAHLCLYYDQDDYTECSTAVTVNWAGTTAEGQSLYMYIPIGGSESVLNQRHSGAWYGNKAKLYSTYTGFYYQQHYLRFEGFQYQFTNNSASSRTAFAFNNQYCWTNDNIFKGIFSGGCSASYGVYTYGSSSGFRIWNNILFDFIESSADIPAISIKGANDCAWVFNNTVHNCYIGISTNGGGYFEVKNNLINDVTGEAFEGTFSSGSGSTHNVLNYSAADGAFGNTHESAKTTDGTESGKLVDSSETFPNVVVGCIVKNTTDTTYTYVTSIAEAGSGKLGLNDDIFISGEGYEIYTNMYGNVTFNNEGSDDYTLDSTDTVAIDKGTDLSSDADLPFYRDIGNDERDSSWDVGADEYISAGGESESESQSESESESASESASPSPSVSESFSESQSESTSESASESQSASESESESQSESISESASESASYSPSASESFSESQSESASESASPSTSGSESESESLSESQSESSSISPSASESYSESESESISKSESESFSESQSISESLSESSSESFSESASESASYSQSESESQSESKSESGSESPSESHSPSPSTGASESQSESQSESASYSPSASESFSESISESKSESLSESTSESFSESSSESPSSSESFSESLSESQSESLSESVSESLSESLSESASESQSISESESESQSESQSESYSESLSESESYSESESESLSESESESQSESQSYSESLSESQSESESYSESVSESQSPSASIPIALAALPIITANGIHSLLMGGVVING